MIATEENELGKKCRVEKVDLNPEDKLRRKGQIVQYIEKFNTETNQAMIYPAIVAKSLNGKDINFEPARVGFGLMMDTHGGLEIPLITVYLNDCRLIHKETGHIIVTEEDFKIAEEAAELANLVDKKEDDI